ncbi:MULTISPECIES: hypothetical protein [Nocardia]|uniref:hypothetical protein n=1 Tax=Nocardia TaxID=1817 RepID=UPI002454E526|nr:MULTISPECIES: hypothetical protein [Nocardia]
MSRLCPSCRDLYDGWVGYRYTGPLGRWRTDPPGEEHADLYWQRSLEALRAAREERAELSRRQCQMVKDLCAARHSPMLRARARQGDRSTLDLMEGAQ